MPEYRKVVCSMTLYQMTMKGKGIVVLEGFQLLHYHKMTKIWTSLAPLSALVQF